MQTSTDASAKKEPRRLTVEQYEKEFGPLKPEQIKAIVINDQVTWRPGETLDDEELARRVSRARAMRKLP